MEYLINCNLVHCRSFESSTRFVNNMCIKFQQIDEVVYLFTLWGHILGYARLGHVELNCTDGYNWLLVIFLISLFMIMMVNYISQYSWESSFALAIVKALKCASQIFNDSSKCCKLSFRVNSLLWLFSGNLQVNNLISRQSQITCYYCASLIFLKCIQSLCMLLLLYLSLHRQTFFYFFLIEHIYSQILNYIYIYILNFYFKLHIYIHVEPRK